MDLCCRINHVDFSMAPHAKTKMEKKKDKEEKKKLSRKERKQKKKMAELENELKEAAASEDLQEKTKFQTETIQQVFWIYFRVLKQKVSLIQIRSISILSCHLN